MPQKYNKEFKIHKPKRNFKQFNNDYPKKNWKNQKFGKSMKTEQQQSPTDEYFKLSFFIQVHKTQKSEITEVLKGIARKCDCTEILPYEGELIQDVFLLHFSTFKQKEWALQLNRGNNYSVLFPQSPMKISKPGNNEVIFTTAKKE